MQRPLDRITITGFKSIRELKDLELRSLNVLIGANGSGKTNFISAFWLLNQIIERNLQVHVGQAGGANTLLYFGAKITDQITIHLTFGDPAGDFRNGYDCVLSPTADDTLIFAQEGCWFHGARYHPSPSQVQLGSGHRETKLYEEAGRRSIVFPGDSIADGVIHALRSWKVYHFHDTGETSRIKMVGEVRMSGNLCEEVHPCWSYTYTYTSNRNVSRRSRRRRSKTPAVVCRSRASRAST